MPISYHWQICLFVINRKIYSMATKKLQLRTRLIMYWDFRWFNCNVNGQVKYSICSWDISCQVSIKSNTCIVAFLHWCLSLYFLISCLWMLLLNDTDTYKISKYNDSAKNDSVWDNYKFLICDLQTLQHGFQNDACVSL